MPNRLTLRQKQVLNAIARFIRTHRLPPTMKELGILLGVSPPSVFQHVQALEKKGFIKRQPLKSRAMRLTKTEKGVAIK